MGGHFIDSALIYGLELIAAIAAIFTLRGFLRWRNATFYIDNSNAKDALVMGFPPQTGNQHVDPNLPGFRPMRRSIILVRSSPVWAEYSRPPNQGVPLPLGYKVQLSFDSLNVI